MTDPVASSALCQSGASTDEVPPTPWSPEGTSRQTSSTPTSLSLATFNLGQLDSANAVRTPTSREAPPAACSLSKLAGTTNGRSRSRPRYNCAAIKAEVEHIIDDESPKIGAWSAVCVCRAAPKLRRIGAVSLAEQTAALFNLASHALLSAGSSCRSTSRAYAEALCREQPVEFPPKLPRASNVPREGFLVRTAAHASRPPAGHRSKSVRILIHHLLHHLALPPHSHTASLAVLGFCYEFGLTNDVVDVPLKLLTGLFEPHESPLGICERVLGEAGPQDTSATVTSPSSCAGGPAYSGSSTPASRSPSAPQGCPLSLATWKPGSPCFRKAELCYVGASYFPSAFAVPHTQGASIPNAARASGNRADLPARLDLRRGWTRHQSAPAEAKPVRHPDHLALSRLAFLRKYGRPGVRIDRREADTLGAFLNKRCEESGSRASTPVPHGPALLPEAEGVFTEASIERACGSPSTGGRESTARDGSSQAAALFDDSRKTAPNSNAAPAEPSRSSIISHSLDADGLAWLEVAASHYAHPASQYAFGVCHHDGVGFKKDENRAFAWYQLSARGGHPRGMGILGYCYIEGFGVAKDEMAALKWYQMAALHNESVAIYNVGYCYEEGIGVEKDPKEAVRWYHLSAEQGNAFAQNSLGYCYEDGVGVDRDEVEATKWYSFSAKQGYPWAECNLGYCYQNGIGVEKDAAAGAMWYSKAALQGHARAQHNLGFCYQNGIGVPQDGKRAVYWYKASAAQNNIFAYHSLGYCYQNGIGVPASEELAIAWYKKAADEGHAPAQLSLGYCYRNGAGVPVSEALAVKYFKLAAEQGNSLAQNSLGFCYEEGLGVEKDPQLAVHWYLKSAQQGNPWAQCNIGYCYAHGFGVERSPEGAVDWYERAARQDHPRAQDKLGGCYQYGNGVQQDLERAVYWYRRAAERHGHVGAMYHLARCLEDGVGCAVDLQEAVRFYEAAGRAGCRDSQKRMTRILSSWCLAGLSFQFGHCAPAA